MDMCWILIKISIIIIIQIQAVRTSLFLSTFSLWGNEERDTMLKGLCKPYYADPTLNAQQILWCLRSLPLEIRKTQPLPSTVNLNSLSFQNPQILRTISSGHDVKYTSASFPVQGLLWQMMIVISSARA